MLLSDLSFFFFLIYLFTYLFLAVGLPCCTWAFSASSQCCSLVAAHGLLIMLASLVAEHGLQSSGSVVVAHRLRCPVACGIFLDQGSRSNLCRFLTIRQPGKSK